MAESDIEKQIKLICQLESQLKQYDLPKNTRLRASYEYDGVTRESIVNQLGQAKEKLAKLKIALNRSEVY